MIIYDDLEPSEKIKVYDKGVSFTDDPKQIHEMRVGYRTGDMWAPKLDGDRGAARRGEHFVDCIEHGKVPETDGQLGLARRRADRGRHQLDARQGRDRVHPASRESIVIPFVDLKAQYASIKTEVERGDPGRARQLPVHAGQRGGGVRGGVRRLLPGASTASA